MIKTCPICSKQFETSDLRKKYCSPECAMRARVKQNSNWNKSNRDEKRLEWAHSEAEHLNYLAYECGIDELADYIYNNYNKRSK